ncbi:hypothetical protein PABG_07512 [Paracoccidioides brasiliensis Pb03]|nr:hypothetical protein PABG_07512 [Paracoccidioides brasiliensis Pb03]
MRRGMTFDDKRYDFKSTSPSVTSFRKFQPLTELRSSGNADLWISRCSNDPVPSVNAQQMNELTSIHSAHKPSLFKRNCEELYGNCVLRCLMISPTGRPIYDYKSPLELLTALRDAIKAQSLYLDGNILHRDNSDNNIIITDPDKEDGYSGMLTDLALSKEVGNKRSGARHQTSMMEFMAIDVLLNIDHTYRHDLESFFYVLIWQCARHG